MTASEKLKALGARLNEFEPKASVDLCVALPQIVAVVEAAENGRGESVLLSSEPWEMVGWPVGKAQALHAALAALDEALS